MNKTTLIMMGLLVLLVPAASAVDFSARSTNVTCDGDIGGTPAYDLATGTTPGLGEVRVTDGTQAIFVAEEAAEIPVSFAPLEGWTFAPVDYTTGGTAFTTEIGIVSADCTTFTTATEPAPLLFGEANPVLSNLGLDVAPGERIALRITDIAEVSTPVDTVFNTASTTVSGPEATPGYPTPSVATIAMLVSGIAMVAGATYVNRRQN